MAYFEDIYGFKLRNIVNIMRYSGTYCMKPEGDGDHIIDCIAIGLKIYSIAHEINPTIRLDKKDLVYRIAIHDFDESVSCDIPRDFKYYNEAIGSEINKVSFEMLAKVVTPELLNDIVESKDWSVPEGRIAKIVDILQASCKIHFENKDLGNNLFSRLRDENLIYLREVVDRLNETDPLDSILTDILKSFISSL